MQPVNGNITSNHGVTRPSNLNVDNTETAKISTLDKVETAISYIETMTKTHPKPM